MPGDWTARGHEYEVVDSSSVGSDGMAVEVRDAEDPTAVELIGEAPQLVEELFEGRPTDA